MRRTVGIIRSLCLLAVALLWLPATVTAQHRGGGHGHHGGTVVVGGGFYAPFYYPYYPYWGFGGWWGPWGYPLGPYPAYWGPVVSSLHIQVSPRETQVYVDGYYAGVVDDFDGFAQRLRLEPGEHLIELHLPGHRNISQTMMLQPGETYRVRHAMQALQGGDPPAERPSPRASVPASNAVSATQGPPPAADTNRAPDQGAALAIRVQPGDAVILIDGQRWETSGGDVLRVQVAPGTHRIDVRKDGFQPFSTTITVRPGGETPVNVSLSPGQ